MTARRVVLGLGVDTPESAIATAAELAIALESALLGLFVEDLDLLRLAALPFARESAAPPAIGRPLDAPTMERALRVKARAAERALARALEPRRQPWTFQVTRGPVLPALIRAAGAEDVVVTIEPARGARRDLLAAVLREGGHLARPLLLLRGPVPRGAPIVVTGTLRAAASATVEALARHFGGEVVPEGRPRTALHAVQPALVTVFAGDLRDSSAALEGAAYAVLVLPEAARG